MSNEIARQIIMASLFTPRANGRWGLPMLGEADPGVGKSSITEYDVRSYGMEPITLIGSLRPAEDFLGFPKVSQDGRSFEYIPPAWAVKANEMGRAVVFFDEFTAGQSPRTFAAMLRIILEGEVGEFSLPKGVRFIGMCNPADQSPGGQELPLPLANRFGHIKWPTPSSEDWVNYLMSPASDGKPPEAKFDPDKKEAEVMDKWHDNFSWAVGMFAGAMRNAPDLLHKVPARDSDQATKGWSSPRSNEFAVRALASSRIHKLDALATEMFVEAFIGHPAASTLFQHINTQDMPDAVDVLDGKAKWKYDPKRLDITYSLLVTMTRLVCNPDQKNNDVRVENYWKSVEPIVSDAPDLMAQHVEAVYYSRNKALKKHPTLKKSLTKLAPILRNAKVSVNK